MTDLQKLIDEVSKSTSSLYPNERTSLALSNHLQKEAVELIQAIKSGVENDIYEELADCLILILNIATKYEIDANKLTKNVKDKLENCKKRKFGDPDENGIIEHIK